MEQITIENLTFSYNVCSGFSLSNVSLQVEEGEILLITGASGCGKTTLLRHLKREYMPQGNRNEDSIIRICGKNLFELNDREQASLVGFVGQDVEAMQVTDKVWHELSFGLENLGCSQDVMERRIAEMTAFFGLEGIYHEKLCDLSGGQKQLVNLAAVMVMEPEVLVLDEPTSQLDPVAATELFRMLWKINKELGTTIVITEHCLEEIFHLCDRVCVMDKGRVEIVDVPQRVARYLYEKKHRLAGALPAAAKLYFACGDRKKEIPLTVNEGRKWFRNCVEKKDRYLTEVNFEQNETMSYAIIADELWYRYEKDGKDILKACDFKVQQSKITAILGGNGTGKSTLLHVLAGHFTPYSGKVKYLADSKKGNQSIGMLPQNPQAMFAKKTVEEELHVSCGVGGNKKMDKEVNPKLQTVIDFCDLGELLHQHPFDLSGGQMQKLALAKLLLEDKEILLLDEPGKGMDYEFKEEMGGLLRSLAQQGKTIVVVSHDIEFCARYADMCGLFFDGHVVSFSQSRSFFLQNTFYTTAITRICRGILPQAVALEDALHAFGTFNCNVVDSSSNEPIKGSGVSDREKVIIHKEEDKKNGIISNADKVIESRSDTKEVVAKNEKRAHRKTAILTFVIVFFVMPFTIYIGHTVLLQRKYYFISLLLILEAIACFFLRFEKRKPKMREIMIVSMMSAIVVAARAAFYMIPSVKPMAALIIITGIGLGAEAGFLVGSMSMLVSNIFFGQGPWTPWQMFTMGMLGFLAGAIFRKGTVETTKKKFAVCVFGLLSVILVYGGIMNPASVLMYQENVNMPMLLSACVMGLPYDAIHGVATFIFLWIGTRPMLNKLQRVKDKSQFLL